MRYIITESRVKDFLKENYINESKVNKMIFLFLDSYLKDYTPEESETLVVYGKGEKNQIAYDKGEKLLLVSNELYHKIQDMFNLSAESTTKVFKAYFESKGLRVKRFM